MPRIVFDKEDHHGWMSRLLATARMLDHARVGYRLRSAVYTIHGYLEEFPKKLSDQYDPSCSYSQSFRIPCWSYLTRLLLLKSPLNIFVRLAVTVVTRLTALELTP